MPHPLTRPPIPTRPKNRPNQGEERDVPRTRVPTRVFRPAGRLHLLFATRSCNFVQCFPHSSQKKSVSVDGSKCGAGGAAVTIQTYPDIDATHQRSKRQLTKTTRGICSISQSNRDDGARKKRGGANRTKKRHIEPERGQIRPFTCTVSRAHTRGKTLSEHFTDRRQFDGMFLGFSPPHFRSVIRERVCSVKQLRTLQVTINEVFERSLDEVPLNEEEFECVGSAYVLSLDCALFKDQVRKRKGFCPSMIQCLWCGPDSLCSGFKILRGRHTFLCLHHHDHHNSPRFAFTGRPVFLRVDRTTVSETTMSDIQKIQCQKKVQWHHSLPLRLANYVGREPQGKHVPTQ